MGAAAPTPIAGWVRPARYTDVPCDGGARVKPLCPCGEGGTRAARAPREILDMSRDSPNPSRDIPDPTQDTPEPSRNIPDPPRDTPDPSWDIPDSPGDIPDPTQDTPDPTQDTPSPTRGPPEPSRDTPGLSRAPPCCSRESRFPPRGGAAVPARCRGRGRGARFHPRPRGAPCRPRAGPGARAWRALPPGLAGTGPAHREATSARPWRCGYVISARLAGEAPGAEPLPWPGSSSRTSST